MKLSRWHGAAILALSFAIALHWVPQANAQEPSATSRVFVASVTKAPCAYKLVAPPKNSAQSLIYIGSCESVGIKTEGLAALRIQFDYFDDRIGIDAAHIRSAVGPSQFSEDTVVPMRSNNSGIWQATWHSPVGTLIDLVYYKASKRLEVWLPKPVETSRFLRPDEPL